MRIAIVAVIMALALALASCNKDSGRKGNVRTANATTAASVSRDQSADAVSAVSAWHVEDKVSQLDGTRSYYAGIASANTMPNSIGKPEHATLIVRCEKGDLAGFISWPPFMGSDGSDVRWKFDDGAIKNEMWPGSNDGTATFVNNPDMFIAMMKKAKRLVVAAKPYETTETEAVFNLPGVDKIATDVLAACGRKY